MGNEKSSPAGLKVVDIIKVSDDWVQKSALLTNEMTKICVFEQHLREENVQNLQNLSKVSTCVPVVLETFIRVDSKITCAHLFRI